MKFAVMQRYPQMIIKGKQSRICIYRRIARTN